MGLPRLLTLFGAASYPCCGETPRKTKIMGQREDAQRRLEAALDRLELVAGQAVEAGDTSALETELAAVRERSQALEWQSQEVSRRLDGAIGRLRSILSDGNGAG